MLSGTAVLAACLACLAAEAFFSGSEIAFVTVNRLRVRVKAEAGRPGARLLERMFETPERVLGTTLVGGNLAVATSTSLVTLWLIRRFGPAAAPLALAMGPILLLFGEIVPKSYCQQRCDSVAPVVAYPLWLFSRLFSPVVALVAAFAGAVGRLAGGGRAPAASPLEPREELRLVLQAGPDGAPLDASELLMIDRIFRFSKTRAEEVMIPLIEVKAIPETATVGEAIADFARFGFSRMPVYRGRVDEIVGIVNAFSLLDAKPEDETIRRFVRKPYYAPEGKPIDELLFHLQKENQYMAVVLDEYGGAVGIVTVEDILEEVVGEIEDEYDRAEAPFKRIDARTFVVKARMEIERANELLKLGIPEGEYETVGGFLLERFGRIPRTGEVLRVGSLTFRVEKATERTIQEVRVSVGAEERGGG